MEKWEDIKHFNFSIFCLVGSGKMEGWKKLISYPCHAIIITSFLTRTMCGNLFIYMY